MPHSYAKSSVFARSAEDVFAFLSDLRNELRWNPGARAIEKLTDGPIGLGTRFRAQWKGTSATTVEVIRFDPPRAWATHSRAMSMDVTTSGHVEAAPNGSRYTVAIDVSASGLARLIAPIAIRMMERGETRNMALIRAALESER